MQYYRVFYTDRPLPPGTTEPDLSLTLPLEFSTKEEALHKAYKLIYSGAIVWKLDGPNGFYLDRAGVEEEYRRFRAA